MLQKTCFEYNDNNKSVMKDKNAYVFDNIIKNNLKNNINRISNSYRIICVLYISQ